MQDKYKNIIKQISKNIVCPICKRTFRFEEIKIKTLMDNIVVFNVQCQNNHPSLQTLHIAIIDKKPNTDQKNLLEKYYKQIDNFDGDFIKIWKK